MPLTWGPQENIRWKAALPGRGLSAPVIAEGRVFVTACTGFNQMRLHILCYDVKDGKKLWERQLWATGGTLCHPKTTMAAPTPITDGKHVYALFATGDLACVDRDGDLVWYRSLVGDYPTVGNNVGMAASPILWNNLVLVCLENAGESFAAGIDKQTGVNVWRVERPRGINWVTPLVIANNGQPELILQGPGALTAYEPSSGKKKWEITDKQFKTIPSPTFGDGMVLTSGEKFFAIKPATAKEEARILWQSAKLPGSYGSPLYHEGRVYMISGQGVLNCAAGATGTPVWSVRVGGSGFAASPLWADGKIYVTSENGTTTVIQPGAEGKVLASNSLEDMILATPVAAEGALFLRSDKFLYCIGTVK